MSPVYAAPVERRLPPLTHNRQAESRHHPQYYRGCALPTACQNASLLTQSNGAAWPGTRQCWIIAHVPFCGRCSSDSLFCLCRPRWTHPACADGRVERCPSGNAYLVERDPMLVHTVIVDIAQRERDGTRREVDVHQAIVLHGHRGPIRFGPTSAAVAQGWVTPLEVSSYTGYGKLALASR